MFIKSRSWYAQRDGQQKAKGLFLVLFGFTESKEIRGVVRTVQMEQLGQFMMGQCEVGGHKITLSGSYGSDGLTMDPEKYPGLWEQLVPLPGPFYELWAKGGGWNSAGSEGEVFRDWALENIDKLYNAGRKRRNTGYKRFITF